MPDKKRAATEDELTKKHGVPVRILDRTWIVEKVFGNDRVALATESLGLTQVVTNERRMRGPNDTQREEELRTLDAQIEDVDRYRNVEYQLAEDCLESAIIARGLGRPRSDVDGRFDRAARIAQKVQHNQQLLRIAYARTWTAFWWFDDYEELSRRYSEVEMFAKDSEQAEDLELLFNLWQILSSSVLQGSLDRKVAELDPRTATLKTALDRLARNQQRPNNAALARTDRLLADLTEAIGNPDRTNAALDGLLQVVQSSNDLVNYPIARLNDLLTELGNAYADNTSFDTLFEAVTATLERRSGEGSAGRAFLQRGMQKLKADLAYEAIRFFGRAQHKLAKREYRAQLVRALVGAGLAYERISLLWAARSSVLSAASYALSEFYERGTIVRAAYFAAQRMAWIEIGLGRIPCALAWGELTDVLMQHIEASDGKQADFSEERESRDLALSMLVLRADLRQLAELNFLVRIFERLGLSHSQAALLYALGYEDRMREDGWISESETSESVKAYFQSLLNQAATADMPSRPELLSTTPIVFRTKVLGCVIEVVVANNLSSIYLSEALLGSLESFLATSLNQDILPYRESFTIVVEPTSDALDVPVHELMDQNGPSVRIRHSTPIHSDTPDAQSKFSDWMMHVIVQIITRIAMIRNVEAYFAQVVGDERGFERSLNTAHVGTIMTNIMGRDPKLRLADWRKGLDGELFPVMRDAPWNDSQRTSSGEESEDHREPVFGEGEPPAELLDRERTKHKDMSVSSMIDSPLWDKAKWSATFFGLIGHGYPPLFGLAFKDKDAAVAIFSEWRRRLGEIDEDERLRISILTGIDKTNPAAYRVSISTKLKPQKDQKLLVIALRSNTMTPRDSKNLDTFREAFGKIGRFVLLPAHLVDETKMPELMMAHSIGKTEMSIRPAWQVGENDPDLMALRPDDDPIIPADVENAPILRALARIRTMRRD